MTRDEALKLALDTLHTIGGALQIRRRLESDGRKLNTRLYDALVAKTLSLKEMEDKALSAWASIVEDVRPRLPDTTVIACREEDMAPSPRAPAAEEAPQPSGNPGKLADRVCTCTGSCRGADGLGPGWVCALGRKKQVEAAPPPLNKENDHGTQAGHPQQDGADRARAPQDGWQEHADGGGSNGGAGGRRGGSGAGDAPGERLRREAGGGAAGPAAAEVRVAEEAPLGMAACGHPSPMLPRVTCLLAPGHEGPHRGSSTRGWVWAQEAKAAPRPLTEAESTEVREVMVAAGEQRAAEIRSRRTPPSAPPPPPACRHPLMVAYKLPDGAELVCHDCGFRRPLQPSAPTEEG